MICGNCGTQNEENVTVCANCGTELAHEQAAPAKKCCKKNRLYALIAVVVSLAAILAILALAFVIRTPRSTVDKFFNAYIQADAEAIMKLVPKEVQTSLLGPEGAQDEAMAQLQQRLNDSLQQMGASGTAYSFKATHTKAIEGEDLAAIQQNYADTYGRKVSAAKTVEVRITAITGEETAYSTATVRVVKIGMSWYLDIFSFGQWIWF